MESTEDIIKTILNLSETDFFRFDPDLLSLKESQLLDLDYMGIAINAPPKIVCSEQVALPIVVATRTSGEREWAVNLIKNCYVVAINNYNGKVFVAKAFVDSKDKDYSETKQSVDDAPPPGLSIAGAQVSLIDLRKKIDFFWDTSSWSICAIYFDWLSNPIHLQLLGDSDSPLPQPASLIAPEPDLNRYQIVPDYRVITNSDNQLSNETSFNLKYTENEEKKILLINATFSIPVKDFHLVQEMIVHTYQDGTQHKVGAIIPVTLILISLNIKAPVQFDWKIPVYGSRFKTGDIIQGAFTFDIYSVENIFLKPGTYLGYLVLGNKIYGPENIQIS